MEAMSSGRGFQCQTEGTLTKACSTARSGKRREGHGALMTGRIPSVDNPVLFNNSIKGDGWHVESMFNIIGDAGFIPHFAHQSLVKYGDKDGKTDRDGGTAYTWRNPFLNGKDHMQFELLGLDDKGIGDAFKAMRNLVVDDLTDDCRTLICPSRFMDDIYRIWCCSRTVKSRFGDYPYDMYFENEYKDYVNPEQTFEPG